MYGRSLLGVGHFGQFLAVRRFTRVTDSSSASIWLLRNHNLSPRRYMLALHLTEYDTVLQRWAGAENLIPDTLSRLLLRIPLRIIKHKAYRH